MVRPVQSVKRPVQGFAKSQPQRAKQQRSRLQLATLGAVSVLFSPLALGVVLADSSSFPLPTSYDSTFATQLQSAQLTNATFQGITCEQYGSTYFTQQAGTGGSNSFTQADLCALPTSDSQFYSTTTPRYYKFQLCSSNPSDYFIVGNLLAASGDLRPYAKDSWVGTDSVQPTPNVTFNLCTQPKVAFAYPSGFVGASSNANYAYIRHSYVTKVTDTVPQNPQNTGFALGGLQVALVLTNPVNQTVFPYSQQGTAVYGTDYTGSTTNGIVVTSSTITLPAQAAGSTYGAFPVRVPVYFNQQNHPQKTLQWAMTAPSGYAFMGQPTWYAQINALNNSTVSVSAINGQSTITPGSTAGGFLLTRSGGDQSVALPVSYTIGGTAANGTDYGYLSGNATIPAGKSTLNVPIIAPQPSGSTAVPQKDVSIALGTPADNSYLVPASGASGQANDFIIPAYNPSTVSFSQASGGTLTPGTPQTITVTRSGGDTSQALTVPYTTGGSATAGSDYNALPGSVTIPAGQTTAAISVAAIQHTGTTAVPAKDLTVTPGSGSGYTTSGTSVSYNIPAYTPSTVSVSSPSNGGNIAAGGTASFTVTRTGDTSQPLTIPYTTGGTATPGTDYNQLPGSITIPAGQTSATQTITTPTQNGSTAVPSKTITLTPQSGSSYSVDPNNSTATYNTAAYTPSTATPAAGAGGSTIPQGTTGGFTITRTGSTTAALPVTYTLGGAAQNGTDYNQLPGSVTIPAGQSSVTVPVTIPAATGSTATPAKDIKVTVNPGNGYAPDSTTPSTTLNIPAFTPASVSFGSGSQGGTLTPGGTSDGFTVTRTGNTAQPLTVGYTTSGSAKPGVDYGQLPGTVTIPAGQSSVTVPLRAFPQSGTTAAPQKDVQIALQSGSGYASSSTTPAVYTIPAYAPNASGNPAVTVSLPSSQNTLLNPGTTRDGFTVTRSGATTSPLSVNYTVGGTGTAGTDYGPLSGTVTIPAGATSATVPISVPAGATDGKTVSISLAPGTGYDQGTNSTVTYTVQGARTGGDYPLPTVCGLSFDPSIPAFVVTRSGGDTTKALTVPVNFGGSGVPGVDYAQLPTSVTFGAGKTTATVPVKLLPTATTGNTITASIPDGIGYTVGSGNGTAFTVPAGYNDGANKAPVASTAKKGGNGSATGFVVAAGVVGGSIAAGTGAFGGGAAAAAGASPLAVPGLLASSVFGTMPQACSTTGETPTELVKLIPQLQEGQPNWSAITFKGLPAPSQAGAVKLGNSTRTWKAGQPVADIVRVGDTDGSFNLHCMGLSKLALLGQLGMAAKPLSTLNLVADTSVQGLSKTLYLRAKKIGDVKGMAEWLASKSGGQVSADQLSGMSFADALKANPTLASLPLGNLPLNQLPGYTDILVGDIPNWSSKAVSQVLGLANVPFSQFPSQPKPLNAFSK